MDTLHPLRTTEYKYISDLFSKIVKTARHALIILSYNDNVLSCPIID